MGPSSSSEERVAFLGNSEYSDHIDLDEPRPDIRVSHARRPTTAVAWLLSRPRTIRRALRRQHALRTALIVAKHVAVLILAILIITPILAPSYTRLPPNYLELKSHCEGPNVEPGCANPFREKVFISVSLYDKGGHLAAGLWGERILEVIHMIGPENAFLSIYENDSPKGKQALLEFKERVPCKHEIVYDDHVSLTDFPNVSLPDGTERMKRLAYLSEMRNRALWPLDKYQKNVGMEFDKVLFMNDVAFYPVEAMQLLFNTNLAPDGHAQYLSACALDYSQSWKFYDLYAQRDAEGYSNGIPFFPIFSTSGQGLSRADMLAQKDAVRVTSCWSGMVAMQAKYVQNMHETLPNPEFQDVGYHVINPDNPTNISVPVRFRYEPEVFFDACECCLFLADVSTAAERDNARETGVYVNPYVRVSYDESVLWWIHIAKRWERLLTIPHRIISWLVGLPRNNPYREVKEGESFVEEVWDEDHWKLVDRVGRSGLFCAVREMQVIQKKTRTGDKNWMNMDIPGGQHLDFPT